MSLSTACRPFLTCPLKDYRVVLLTIVALDQALCDRSFHLGGLMLIKFYLRAVEENCGESVIYSKSKREK